MTSLRLVVVTLLFSLCACQTAQVTSSVAPMKLAEEGDIDSFNSIDSFDNDDEGTSFFGSSSSKSLFKAVVHQESGGRNHVVSHAGAVGRAQLTIPTARIMARKLGMYKVAKLPRRRLRRMLMRNPSLSERLGKAYLDEGRRKYGRDDIALIYYNGGPRAANAAYRSYKRSGKLRIYTSETYCYVKSIARKSGIETAPMKLVRGRAYRKNRARWIRRTGRAPCRA